MMVDITACPGTACPMAERCTLTHYQRTYGHEWWQRNTITNTVQPAYDQAVQYCPNYEEEHHGKT
jgi:hypothetical protein